jgi:hypothetical protein
MMLQQSSLLEHQEFVFYLCKKGTWDEMTCSNIAEHSESVLLKMNIEGKSECLAYL